MHSGGKDDKLSHRPCSLITEQCSEGRQIGLEERFILPSMVSMPSEF